MFVTSLNGLADPEAAADPRKGAAEFGRDRERSGTGLADLAGGGGAVENFLEGQEDGLVIRCFWGRLDK